MNPIQSLPTSSIAPGQSPGMAQAPKDASSFKNFLVDSIQEVNSVQQDADAAVEQLFTGGDVTPAEVLTAVQKADVAFRLMLQVRNKMVGAFEEIKNLRI